MHTSCQSQLRNIHRTKMQASRQSVLVSMIGNLQDLWVKLTARTMAEANPMVGPTTLQWQGFWSVPVRTISHQFKVDKVSIHTALEADEGDWKAVHYDRE